MTRDGSPTSTDRRSGGGAVEILGLGAFALVAMGLLAFGYNTRESSTATVPDRSIQAQQPADQDRLSPPMASPVPTTSSSGLGESSGEQPAPSPK